MNTRAFMRQCQSVFEFEFVGAQRTTYARLDTALRFRRLGCHCRGHYMDYYFDGILMKTNGLTKHSLHSPWKHAFGSLSSTRISLYKRTPNFYLHNIRSCKRIEQNTHLICQSYNNNNNEGTSEQTMREKKKTCRMFTTADFTVAPHTHIRTRECESCTFICFRTRIQRNKLEV